MNARQLALLSLLSALSVGIQLIPRPPNVEFTSLVSFTAGFLFGFWAGAVVGAMTMFVNGFLSPWGLGGLNIPFQMGGMIIAGVLGHAYKTYASNKLNLTSFCLETAVLGGLIALIYDFITNVGVGIQYIISGMDPALALFSAIAYGSFFSLIHIFSNSAVFGSLFLPIVNALGNLKTAEGEQHWSKKEHSYSQR